MDEKRKIMIKKLYKSCACRKCGTHMVQVTSNFICQQCISNINRKRKSTDQLPDTPDVLLTFLAKIARKLMDLPIPGDFASQSVVVVSQPKTLMPVVEKIDCMRDFLPVVKEYLQGLRIFLMEPIKYYDQNQLQIFSERLRHSGANVSYFNEKQAMGITHKAVILVEMSSSCGFNMKSARDLVSRLEIPMIGITEFIYAIKTGICTPAGRAIERLLTPASDTKIMWRNKTEIFRPEEMLKVADYDSDPDPDFDYFDENIYR